MKKTIIVTVLLVGLSICVRGQQPQQATQEEALQVATHYLAEIHELCSTCEVSIFRKMDSIGNTVLYEVIIGNQIVLLSGSKACVPILGNYSSEDGSLLDNYHLLPEHLKRFIDHCINQIEICFANDTIRLYHQDEWRRLASASTFNYRDNNAVAPLITTQWGQSECNIGTEVGYNYYIPSDANCEHCLAGCVAVAIAQVMNYWQSPVVNTYNFQQFDWCNMSDILNCYSNSFFQNRHAIAYLLYMIGLSVNMEYGCDGSSSNIDYARNALVNKFGYHTDAVVKKRSDAESDSAWFAMIREELRNGHPVIYRGIGTGGHEFVIDGFNNNGLFHINWGWNGDRDGYFSLSHLTPPGYNFNSDQKAIIHLYPSTIENICYSVVSLSDFYEAFYQEALFQVIPPYLVVPSTMTVLKSANISAPEEWRTIPAGAQTTYQAHKEVILKDGFTVERGADFVARIEPCTRCEDRFIQPPTPQDDLSRGITGDVSDVRVEQSPSQAFTMLSQIQLFPNPTSEDVTIAVDGEVESVVVYNTMGMPMGGWRIRALSVQQATLDMSSMSSGMYIVVVKKTDGQVVYGRIVKN